jgi:hypothetical protein
MLLLFLCLFFIYLFIFFVISPILFFFIWTSLYSCSSLHCVHSFFLFLSTLPLSALISSANISCSKHQPLFNPSFITHNNIIPFTCCSPLLLLLSAFHLLSAVPHILSYFTFTEQSDHMCFLPSLFLLFPLSFLSISVHLFHYLYAVNPWCSTAINWSLGKLANIHFLLYDTVIFCHRLQWTDTGTLPGIDYVTLVPSFLLCNCEGGGGVRIWPIQYVLYWCHIGRRN